MLLLVVVYSPQQHKQQQFSQRIFTPAACAALCLHLSQDRQQSAAAENAAPFLPVRAWNS